MGRCHTDSTNSESYTMECQETSTTGRVQLNYYDSADCSGGSTEVENDEGALGCTDADDDGDGDDDALMAYEFGCSTSKPWTVFDKAVLFE